MNVERRRAWKLKLGIPSGVWRTRNGVLCQTGTPARRDPSQTGPQPDEVFSSLAIDSTIPLTPILTFVRSPPYFPPWLPRPPSTRRPREKPK